MTSEKYLFENINIEDTEIKDFVEKIVTSFIKWDILNFFQKNPNARVTLKDLVLIIGRNLENTGREIEELIKGKMVEKQNEGNLIFYVFSPDRAIRSLIDNFISYCESGREARLKIVYKILKRNSEKPNNREVKPNDKER